MKELHLNLHLKKQKLKLSHKLTYRQKFLNAIKSLLKGLQLTFRHFSNAGKQTKPASIRSDDYFTRYNEGLITVQYPHEMLPVPDNGRYRLHNEIDDCIVCDQCAKICPVDCIEIEPIKSPEVYGHTSDGTPKRIHAAKFDIDMAKCCFCGLCTVVCPTECLTMTKTFDFSEYDVDDHTYAFADMSDEDIQEKMNVWEAFEKNKPEKSKGTSTKSTPGAAGKAKAGKPVFRPKVKSKPSDPGKE